MPRRLLALLLVVSWVFFSALDLYEDLDFSDEAQIYGGRNAAHPGIGQAGRWANNMVESAHDSEQRRSVLLDQFTVQTSNSARNATLKPSRLHKLHRVFLI